MTENEVCVANITAAGRRRRLVLGAAVLGASVLGWFGMIVAGLYGSLLNLLLLAPIAFGWLCVIQAVENT